MRAAYLVIVILASARFAAADMVRVKVVEVAGELAYVTPGRSAGVVAGTKVTLHGAALVVIEATEGTAAVKLDEHRAAIGDVGSAEVARRAMASGRVLPPVRAPELFVGQWPEPELPAAAQDPRRVALGSGKAKGRAHVTVVGNAFAVASADDRAGNAEGRVIASFDAMADRPLAVDLDVAGRVFGAGYSTATRTPLFVRTAQLRYGAAADPRVALGRLRYAASSVGMLDGGRASVRIGDLQLGAFGGVVPDPLSGKPDTDAARFGGELAYDNARSSWQPRVAVTAYGSTWHGNLDERRLSLSGSASRGGWWLDGWIEAQGFSSDNPWNARAVEVVGSGASAQWRKRGLNLGIDVSYVRPERSLRLAAALPPEWLCTLTFETGDASTTCARGDYSASSTVFAGLRAGRWTVDAVGSGGVSRGLYSSFDRSGLMRAAVHLGQARLETAVAAGKASFGSWMSGELGGAYAPSRRFDTSLRYRPEILDHVASTGPVVLHSLVGDGRYAASADLDVAMSMVVTTGADREVVAILATVAWRPLP
jgi:hypothetical protein